MEIHIFGFVMGLLLLAIPYVLLNIFDARLSRKLSIAIVKMLLAVGITAAIVFVSRQYNNVYIDILLSVIIVFIASLLIVNRAKVLVRHYLLPVFVSLTVSVAVLTTYLLFVVMTTAKNQYLSLLLPITTILSLSAVFATSQGLSAYRMGIEHRSRLYYFLVANGASYAEALYHFVRRAIQQTTMPAIRSFAAIGTATAPVMMWIMVMNGATILTAAAFQIVIMAAMAATAIFSLILTLLIARRYTIDEYGQLKPERTMKQQLPPTEQVPTTDENVIINRDEESY